jgi:hypothetical protein
VGAMSEKQFERRAGLTIALLAAVLAINDLFGGKFDSDAILGTNEMANAYNWYQSKTQRQSLDEHQIQLLRLVGGEGAADQIALLEADIARYRQEKREILEGSEAVGPSGQVLEDEAGNKGQIVGARVWKARLAVLDEAGDRFDLGALFLQICLVLGAVSLVLDDTRLKERFYWTMTSAGVVGTLFTVWALVTALAA